MPYKGVESFKIDEEVVRRWAWDLKPSTAKTYVFYFLKFLEWCKEKGYWSSAEEMLENAKKADTETLYKHLDIILEYIKSCKTGFNDRRIRHQAIRNFYEYYRVPLPRPSRHELSRIFSPSETDKIRAVSLPPLTIEEVRQIIIHSPQPYKAAYMVCFQAALGASEFDQFNRYAWKQIINKLDEDGPIKIELVRSKVSRTEVKSYYKMSLRKPRSSEAVR